MKKTLLVTAMAIALALSTMAGAMAKGNAPGHENDTGAIKGTGHDGSQEVEYLFNKAGYHFWFTATDPGWGPSGFYEPGKQYHNVYKYQVGDPSEWCPNATTVPDREPYNLGGTAGETAYYKIWNVTDQEPVCGTFQIVTGDVLWSPSSGPNEGTEIESAFTAYIDGDGVGSGQIETTNTAADATSNITIDCVEYEGTEVWMSGFDADSDPVIAYARAGDDLAFNQWTNPNVSPQDCTARWSGASNFISGTIEMF